MSKQKKCFIFLKTKKSLLTIVLLLAISVLHAQTIKVSGSVYDESGFPLPGVSVIVEGTNKGAATDFDGKYSIEVAPNSELTFRYLGFVTQKIKVTQSRTLDVTLVEDVAKLDEVVVVGYGTQKKESVVGAIAQLDGDALVQRGTVPNLTDALSGSLPGVTVLTGTGIPGGQVGGDYENSEIFIRGRTTWNDASPLVLVDGVERTLNDVDPETVKSISVLKDASATAVFGVKGGNGVILITTKRGKTGEAQFKVDANLSIKSISRIPKVLEGVGSTEAKNRAIVHGLSVYPTGWNDYASQEELGFIRSQELPFAYPNTDWAEIMLNDSAISSRVNLSVSGGTDFVKYYGSIGYLTDGDILNTEDVGQGYDPDFKYDRYNFRTNLDFTLTKTTKLGVNLDGYYGIQQRSGAPIFNFWYGVYSKPWTHPILQYEDGTYGNGNGIYERFGQNEYVELNFQGVDINNRGEINALINLQQELDFITKGLKTSAELSYNSFYTNTGAGINDDGVLTKYVDPVFYTLDDPNADIEDYTSYFFPGEFVNTTDGFEFIDAPLNYQTDRITQGDANNTQNRLLIRLRLNYNRSFGKHDVGALALFSREEVLKYFDRLQPSLQGFPQKSEDWVGRFTYGYDGRYNVELNGAYNGTERFGPGYKFGFFPSVGVGWTVSNEKFFEKARNVVNKLKFRYSDGEVGNNNARSIGQWPYFTSFNSGGSIPFGDGANFNGPLIFSEGNIGNPFLQWETARKQNFGMELGLFNNKFTAEIDLFREDRDNILVNAAQRNVPDFFGAPAPAANIGITESEGYEITAKYMNNIGNFNYWAQVNYTYAKDKIIAREDSQLLPDYQKQAGFQIGQTRSTLSTGIINSFDELYTGVVGLQNNNLLPGDYRLLDYNADGFIDPNDFVPYGYPSRPQNTYNLMLGADYKGFSFNVNFFGQYNLTQTVGLSQFAFDAPAVYPEQVNNTWLPGYGNSNPTFPALSYNRSSSNAEFYEMDGSMFRLKTAEVAYSLPKKFISNIGLSALRVFVNGNNLILWSDLPVDLEGRDFDYRNYPVTKQVNFGLTATF